MLYWRKEGRPLQLLSWRCYHSANGSINSNLRKKLYTGPPFRPEFVSLQDYKRKINVETYQ